MEETEFKFFSKIRIKIQRMVRQKKLFLGRNKGISAVNELRTYESSELVKNLRQNDGEEINKTVERNGAEF